MPAFLNATTATETIQISASNVLQVSTMITIFAKPVSRDAPTVSMEFPAILVGLNTSRTVRFVRSVSTDA